MQFSTEALLMLAVGSIYIFDSARLLERNQGLAFAPWRNQWTIRLGSEWARLAGRFLFIPNPLLPHVPIFGIRWDLSRSSTLTTAGHKDWVPYNAELRALAPLVWGMMVAVFILLPAGLFTGLGRIALLSAVVLLYISIVAALVWVHRRRARFGLTRKAFAQLAIQSLVSPITALNIVRRLAWGVQISEDLELVARRLQSSEAWATTRSVLIARCADELDIEDEDSPRARAIRTRRDDLIAEIHSSMTSDCQQ